MAYPISDVPRRIVYSGSAGVGPYAFTFEVLTSTDIAVYKNTTLLTLTTDYTVSINTGTGTGTVTLVVAATGADTVVIVGNRAIQRSSDFVTGGDLFAQTLNDELDSLTIYAQQVDEKADRAILIPVTDPTTLNMVLPSSTSRASKYLAFNTSGEPIATTGSSAVAPISLVMEPFVSASTLANARTILGISDNAVTTAKIADLNVTTAKIADANVTAVKLANGSATLAKLDTTGTTGAVLTAQGSGNAPIWRAGSDTVRIDVASASTVNLTTGAPDTRHINITGTTTITAFTVVSGLTYFVRFNASLTLTNNASIITQSGASITTQAGDTCILRSTAANTVEVVSYVPAKNASQPGTAPVYGARAWVNFNGTGTVAINGSGNVTSITDNGTGEYTVNFTTAMPDANYAVAGHANWTDDTNANGLVTAQSTSTKTSSAVKVYVTNSTTAWGAGKIDVSQVSVSVFR